MSRVRLFRKYIIFEMFAWGFTIKANYYIHRNINNKDLRGVGFAIILDVHENHIKY